jgi:hypothetical protein
MKVLPGLVKISLYYLVFFFSSVLFCSGVSLLLSPSPESESHAYGFVAFGLILFVFLFIFYRKLLTKDSAAVTVRIRTNIFSLNRILSDFLLLVYFSSAYLVLFLVYSIWFYDVHGESVNWPILFLYLATFPICCLIIFNNVGKLARWVIVVTPIIWTLVFLCLEMFMQ